MQFFLYLLAAVVAVHSAPSGLSSLCERDSSSGSSLDPTTTGTAPFVPSLGHVKRALLSPRFRSAPAISPFIIQTIESFSFLHCYTDSTVSPALNGKSYSSDSMTIELCAATCAGFQLFGIQNARDCYCGDALEDGSVPESEGATTQCNMACNGNPFEYCGGPERLQIYGNTVMAMTSTASTISSSSMTSTSSSTTASSTDSMSTSSTSSSISTPSTDSTSSSSSSSTSTSLTDSTSTSSVSSADSYSTTSTSTTTSTYASSMPSTGSSSASSTSSSSSTFTTSTTSSTTSASTTASITTSTLTTSIMSSTSTSTSSSTTQSPISTGRAVFAHYMVTSITQDQANTDVQQAQDMGLDGFALNVVTATESWSNDALQCLFSAASGTGFQLFLSMDMTQFANPTDAIPLIQQWHADPSYYKRDGLSFVSTFDGGAMTFGYPNANAGWQATYRNALNALSIPTYFVPVFDDSPVSPSSFFNTFPVVDGLFAWENSWPWGSGTVSSSIDQQYFSAAQSAGKTYMMGISAVQFKHMQPSLNYYRTGGLDLALRIAQILSLGPDLVQIQTWNDAGESHYIGQIWPEALSGTNVASYTTGYDHSGWQVLLAPFIIAYKAGITDVSQVVPVVPSAVEGVFWHSTLLSTASCYGDSLGKPSGSEYLQDTIEVAVIIPAGTYGLKVNVYSGNQIVGQYNAVPGLNAWEVQGLQVGLVQVTVTSQSGKLIVQGNGPISVQADSNNCNYNPQVVVLEGVAKKS